MKKKIYTLGVTFFITPEMSAALKKISDHNEMSLSELLRNIIKEFLKDKGQ
jgi:hypothetical protein